MARPRLSGDDVKTQALRPSRSRPGSVSYWLQRISSSSDKLQLSAYRHELQTTRGR